MEWDIRNSILDNSVSPNCLIQHIATDGVYFKSSRTVSYVVIVPGSRQTVVISCSQPGTFYLTNVADTSLRPDLTVLNNRYQQNMVTLVVSGSSQSSLSELSLSLSLITRPSYLNDLTSTSANVYLSLSASTSSSLRIGTDCSYISYSSQTCQTESFSGKRGVNGTYSYITTVSSITQLQLYTSASATTALRIHANTGQIVASPDTAYFGNLGDWRDTFPVRPLKYSSSPLIVAYKVNSQPGETLIHSCNLYAEDSGVATSYFSTAEYISQCVYAADGCSILKSTTTLNDLGNGVWLGTLVVLAGIVVTTHWKELIN
jgi:FtsP/CotA-like multicopper oxidase with cupredoxin domain